MNENHDVAPLSDAEQEALDRIAAELWSGPVDYSKWLQDRRPRSSWRFQLLGLVITVAAAFTIGMLLPATDGWSAAATELVAASLALMIGLVLVIDVVRGKVGRAAFQCGAFMTRPIRRRRARSESRSRARSDR
jgi:hypothetical protein